MLAWEEEGWGSQCKLESSPQRCGAWALGRPRDRKTRPSWWVVLQGQPRVPVPLGPSSLLVLGPHFPEPLPSAKTISLLHQPLLPECGFHPGPSPSALFLSSHSPGMSYVSSLIPKCPVVSLFRHLSSLPRVWSLGLPRASGLKQIKNTGALSYWDLGFFLICYCKITSGNKGNFSLI